MSAVHDYNATITWTGNRGVGTSGIGFMTALGIWSAQASASFRMI